MPKDLRLLNELRILNNPKELLFKPLEQTSSLGVDIFVYTYFAKSAYILTLQVLRYEPFNLELCGSNGSFPEACDAISYLDGACFLASTLAILNIIVFEHNLNDILKREHFNPYLKFLSVKLLVSIAFFQYYGFDIVMVVLLGYSTVQFRLAYACLICLEVLPLGILIFVAWRPTRGDWYSGDNFFTVGSDGSGNVGRLANESGSFCESVEEAFTESRQPSDSMSAGRMMPQEVTGVIELRGDVKVGEGQAIEELINKLSSSIRAQFKPAALYRGLGLQKAYWAADR